MSKNTWKGNYGIGLLKKNKIKTKQTNKRWLTKLKL